MIVFVTHMSIKRIINFHIHTHALIARWKIEIDTISEKLISAIKCWSYLIKLFIVGELSEQTYRGITISAYMRMFITLK